MVIQTREKVVVIAGLVLVGAFGLFPPWIHTYYRTGTSNVAGHRHERDAGHQFILNPPSPESPAVGYGVKLDVNRLAIEWAVIAALTTAAALALRGKTRTIEKDTPIQPGLSTSKPAGPPDSAEDLELMRQAARDAIARGKNAAAVASRFKEMTGQDL